MTYNNPVIQQDISHVGESDFCLLRFYIENEISNDSLKQLIELTQNTKDNEACFYSFIVPIRLNRCYQISNEFTEFILYQQQQAMSFAQQIIYKHVKNCCNNSNQIAIRFVYDKLPARPEFRVSSNMSQADLLSRSHPVRLTGTVMASSAVSPYIRGLTYVCHNIMCPLNSRKRQKYVLFNAQQPYNFKPGQIVLCDGCNLYLHEDINKRWISEKLTVAVKIREPEIPILSSTYRLEPNVLLSNVYTVIIRDEYVSSIRLGGKYDFICHSLHDCTSNEVVFETLHCELIQLHRLSLPDSIRHLHDNFAHYSFSFLNILSTLFCPHIQIAKYCTHVKMGLILSLVSPSIHILIVGNESRVSDVLCQTALRYCQNGFIHRQQYPLTIAAVTKSRNNLFIVSAGSIAMGGDGITYLESIDCLSKSQIKQLILAFETKSLTIEVNRSEDPSKVIYTIPFNSNIWAYHDSRLWKNKYQNIEPANDLSSALVDSFSLVLSIGENDNDYGETIECYLDSLLHNTNQQEIIDESTNQWVDDIRSFLAYVRLLEIPMSIEAETVLKQYFCACRRTKRTCFAYTELPSSTTDVLTRLCEAVAKCNVHMEATESDMIMAIYIFEISTVTRLGCENLVSEHYRSTPVLDDPMLIDLIEQRMIRFSRELSAFCSDYA